jgi:hypothetical protein
MIESLHQGRDIGMMADGAMQFSPLLPRQHRVTRRIETGMPAALPIHFGILTFNIFACSAAYMVICLSVWPDRQTV